MDYQTEYSKHNPDYHRREAPRKLQDIVNTYKGEPLKVMDVGCGVGLLSGLLYKHYLPQKIVAIDISKRAIKEAKLQKTNINFYAVDVMKYFPTEEFDTIFIADLMEHIVDEIAFLKKISSFGKELVIRIPLEDTLANRIFRRLGLADQFADSRVRYGHIHSYNIDSLQKLFSKTGLNVINLKVFPLAKRSKWYFELLRWISLTLWPISKYLSANTFGAFAVFVLKSSHVPTPKLS